MRQYWRKESKMKKRGGKRLLTKAGSIKKSYLVTNSLRICSKNAVTPSLPSDPPEPDCLYPRLHEQTRDLHIWQWPPPNSTPPASQVSPISLKQEAKVFWLSLRLASSPLISVFRVLFRRIATRAGAAPGATLKILLGVAFFVVLYVVLKSISSLLGTLPPLN